MQPPELKSLDRKLKLKVLIIMLIVALEFLGVIDIPWWLVVYPLIWIINMVLGILIFILIMLRWL